MLRLVVTGLWATQPKSLSRYVELNAFGERVSSTCCVKRHQIIRAMSNEELESRLREEHGTEDDDEKMLALELQQKRTLQYQLRQMLCSSYITTYQNEDAPRFRNQFTVFHAHTLFVNRCLPSTFEIVFGHGICENCLAK